MGPQSTRPLRGAVIGLGMIGRHHARLLQGAERIAFAGAVDPAGDRYRSIHDGGHVFDSVSALLADGPLDLAVVAVPTDAHLPVARELMSAGVSVLIEKPLAATVESAREIVRLAEAHGVHGAVGHVERFNVALQEMRRRVVDGQLGRLYALSTIRSGPYSGRVRDVGVIKDLATHDIDIVGWLSDSRIAQVSAQTQHFSGQEYEDLVLVTGSLESGPAFNLVVDRLSPTKVRRTRVLGERGMLEADTLTGDLFFYENAEVDITWSTTQQFRGVSEGNVTRYALRRDEPLRVELETFIDLVKGDSGVDVVGLERGVEIVQIAETVSESARTGRTLATAAIA
ncbi:MAG TPA: Gfo/Idh/MocA family oxidoreductase [Solirubrobacteraceae bacterium]|nr:Gfo/Idh/MocA family oxidoreductase [Solirubrobacteraceae bacterium]